jgi:transposase-like protein
MRAGGGTLAKLQQQTTTVTTAKPDILSFSIEKAATEVCRSQLEQVLREGAIRLLIDALEREIADFIQEHREVRDSEGRQAVVRNGHTRARTIQTGLGPVEVQVPRARDRNKALKFTSKILPPYLRRVPSIDNLIPTLYLKGVSDEQMGEALAAILGEGAAGLSAASVRRLRESWSADYEAWNKRDLTGKRYVYLWADGIYCNVRLTDERPCLLVLVGSLPDGTKELVAIHDGVRESKLSWMEVLHDLRKRGLAEAPELAIGDGALGFWAALPEVFSSTRTQRCWVHKTANVLDKMPKSVQPGAKKKIHDIYLAQGRKQAGEAFEDFRKIYAAKYPKAWECLEKDRDALLAFYDFPAEHWAHIRSTNPIESLFATVRHRQRQTKGNGSRSATLAMAFKLSVEAEKKWRRLRGHAHLAKVVAGVRFIDGIEEGVPNPLENVA